MTTTTTLTPHFQLPVDFNSFAGTRAAISSPIVGAIEVQDIARYERNYDRHFILKDKTGKHYNEDVVAVLSVAVTHEKDYKRFRVSINRITVGDRMWRMAVTFGQGQPVKDWAIPCERYSTKRHLEAFHVAMVEIDEHLPALFEWAAGAIEENKD